MYMLQEWLLSVLVLAKTIQYSLYWMSENKGINQCFNHQYCSLTLFVEAK